MAILSSTGPLISGQIGDLIYRIHNGRQFVAHCPKPRTKPPTAAEIKNRQKFGDAVRRVKELWNDPTQRALYEAAAGRKSQSAFAYTVGVIIRQG